MSQARMVRDLLLFTSREDHVGFGVKASFTPRKIAQLASRMNILPCSLFVWRSIKCREQAALALVLAHSASVADRGPPTETNSKIHRQFRNAHEGNKAHAGLDPTRASTGVIWCTERAYEHGFAEEPEKWANLGQGAPEVDDDIKGSFPRPTEIDISMAGREYGPTAGIKPLRAAVARLYNEHHRQGKESQYSWENVCIVPGGRAGLIRIAAVLNNAYLGFFIPDYTAYNEMLSLFKNVSIAEEQVLRTSGIQG